MRPAAGDYVSRSRGVAAQYYYIITPDNLVPNALPFLDNIVVRPLVTPRPGRARFGQYLLDLAPEAQTSRPISPGFEHFFYTLAGTAVLESDAGSHSMPVGGFAYVPDSTAFTLKNGTDASRLVWVKQRYQRVEGLGDPRPILGMREDVELRQTPLEGAWSRRLMPIDDSAYDFTMLVLSFAPGVYFDQVEIHHQEHGLYMLQGQGVYYLAGDFHEIVKDDFIYMAPYCPQYFYATGATQAEYLLYKDMNRDGF